MHPLMRLENESKSGAISVHLFLPLPLSVVAIFRRPWMSAAGESFRLIYNMQNAL
jgi:hypothetical protein